MAGQADPAPDAGLDSLASFLVEGDKSEDTAIESEAKADDSTDELDTEVEGEDQSDESEGEPPEEDADPEAKQEPDRKIKVTVKGDDGAESTVEVDEKELVQGYQRQADYTRKTQQLAARESEAVELLSTKFREIQGEYVERIEQTRQAVLGMAGLKNAQEMAHLANTDPAGWVAEQQRQQAIGAFLSQLEEQAKAERNKAETAGKQAQEGRKKAAFEKAWGELSKAKIDKPALGKIFGDVSSGYGFTPGELGEVLDHRIVLMMRDAAAYRALQAKKPEVTKKVQDAPRLPSKQATSQQQRASRELDAKFKSGNAKLKDLAAYLM